MPEPQFKPQAFGKYILIDKISSGGMGEVYKAKSFGSQGFEKFFAIKRILPKLSKAKTFITMLGDEAKIIVSLGHSNIVPVYEFNQVADSYYLAMEFIHGKDLRRVMERVDSIPFEIACYFIAQLAQGLHYLHIARDANGKKLGIVHRDISPRNIIVSFNGEVKIIDFGIANAQGRAFHIASDIFVGKYAYMSPEQLLGKELTPQSDIFSAGIVLYELLFKKLPPGRMNDKKVLALGQDESQVDPRLDKNLMSTLSQELRSIIEKATALNPDDRYINALALYTDLMRFIVTHDDSVNAFSVARYIKNLFAGDMYEREEGVKEAKTITPKEAVSSFTEQKKVAVLHINMKHATSEGGIHKDVLSMFQEVLRMVLKHDGMIYRLQDTTLITVFGLPKNKEDDATRALRVALEVRRYVNSLKLGFTVTLTMALDFGTVIVNFQDEDLHEFKLSEGPERQVQTLLAVASAGDILCGSSIAHMTKNQFEFSKVERNGKHYSTLVNVVHDVSSTNHKEQFINRKKELEIVDTLLAEVTQDKGKTITITGEAGIGKSALVREIVRRAQASNTRTFIGSFHPYIKTPYAIFRQLIAELCSGEPTPREISRLELEKLEGYGLSPMELESIKSIVSMRYKNETLDAFSADQKKLIIFVALKKIVSGFAQHKAIIIMEDLHRADELSLEALDFICASDPLPHLLLIKTNREKFSYEWKNKNPEEVRIELTPLDKSALRNYVETITELPLEENTMLQIYSKSSGNPLFAGEITKSLLDTNTLEKNNNTYMLRGGKDMSIIPNSIYPILATRVDSLSKPSKEILRCASIMGDEFDVDTLEFLSNKDPTSLKHILVELERAGMIQETPNGFSITHALLRDVVYENTPPDMRQSLHKRLADYLTEKYTAELEEHTNELAYHYSKSNDHEKAFHYLIKAGDESEGMYLLNEADRYYREAIECFKNNKDLFADSTITLIDLHYKVSITNQLLGKLREALILLNEAIKLSKEYQIYEFVPKIYREAAHVFGIKGDYEKALHYIQRAIDRSTKANNQFDTLEFLRKQASIYRQTNNTTKALEILEKGLLEAKRLGDKELISKYLNSLAIIYEDSDYKKALRYFKESFFIRKEMKDKLGLAIVFANISVVFSKIHKFDKAIVYAQRSLHISSLIEDKLGLCLNLTNLGEFYVAQDELDKALSYALQGLAKSREMTWKQGIVLNAIHISLINVLKKQNIAGAKSLLEEALQGAKELNNPEFIAKAYLVQSKILSLEKKVEESKLVFKNARELIAKHKLSNLIQDFEKKVAR